MKRRQDMIYAIALVLLLVIAVFIGNAIIKGVALLLFSTVLIVNTIMRLQAKNDDKIGDKILCGVLLFLEAMIALGSIYVIITTLIK